MKLQKSRKKLLLSGRHHNESVFLGQFLQKKLNSNKKSHPAAFIVPVAAGVIFLILSMLNLQQSIWFDESYSAYLTRGSFAEIWQLTAMDVHPPLYYVLLKVWGMVFGNTDFGLRFMSVFFGLVAIIFSFQVMKKLFGLRTASFATVAMAFSPILLRYGQEMRMYTLVFAIVIIAMYVLILALERQKLRYWLIYGVLVSLGMWTHYFSALAWLAQLAYIIYYYHKHPLHAEKKSSTSKNIKINTQEEWRSFWQGVKGYRNTIFSYVLAVGLFLPWMPSFLHQMMDVENGFWIGAINLVTPLDFLGKSLIYAGAEEAEGWLAILVIGVVIFTTYFAVRAYKNTKSDEKKNGWWLIWMMILVPPTLLIMLSLPPLRSLFVDRYVAYAAILIWGMVGVVISWLFSQKDDSSRVRNFILKTAYIVLVITTAVVGIVRVEMREPGSSVKEVVMLAEMMAEEGEPILVSGSTTYYDAILYSTETHPIYGVDAWYTYQWGSLEPIRKLRYNLIDDLGEFLDEQEAVWVVMETEKYSTPEGMEGWRVVEEVGMDGVLALRLVEE